MIDLNNWKTFIPELSQKEVEIPHFDRASRLTEILMI